MLEAYPDMYNGQNDTLNIKPMDFQLKPGSKAYNAKLYPIFKAYEIPSNEVRKMFSQDTIWYHTLDRRGQHYHS